MTEERIAQRKQEIKRLKEKIEELKKAPKISHLDETVKRRTISELRKRVRALEAWNLRERKEVETQIEKTYNEAILQAKKTLKEVETQAEKIHKEARTLRDQANATFTRTKDRAYEAYREAHRALKRAR